MSRLRVALGFACVSLVTTQILCGQTEPDPYPGMPPTVESNAQLETIHSSDQFFEGPTWDPASERLFFTAFGKAQNETSILVWSQRAARASVWAAFTEGTNGTILTDNGSLLGAQSRRQRLVEYELGDRDSMQPKRISTWMLEPNLNQPNDLTRDADGFIYFSDPDFAKSQRGGVYRYVKGQSPERLPGDLIQPNGLELSADGKLLVVADSQTKKWYAYDLKLGSDVNEMKPPRVFFDPNVDSSKAPEGGVPDGMALDEQGNFYLTGLGGVWCVTRNAKAIGFIPIPEFVSNVCFGGSDGKWLFVTCQDKVYRLRMNVKGYVVPPLCTWANAPTLEHSILKHETYESRIMQTSVGYSYWLPPGYEDSPNRHYPVLYWLHGLGGNESARDYPIGSLATKISLSEIPPMIFVQVNGGARSVYADSYNGKNLAETTIIEELIPHIDSRFRTLANRGGRSIQGMSMGGEGALRFAAKYPQHFGSVLAYAGGFVSHSELQRYRPRIYDEMFDRRPERFERSMASTYLSENAGTIRQQVAIRLLCGTADESIHLQRHIARLCREKDIAIEAIEVSGAQHDFRQLILRTDSDDFSFAAKHFAIP